LATRTKVRLTAAHLPTLLLLLALLPLTVWAWMAWV
jgi:hypothetical protein